MAARSKRWCRAEILFLITTLEDMDILKRLDGRKHNNGDLFKAVASKMVEEGFHQRDDHQIRNKWKLLKQEYNKARAHNNKSGSDASTFEFYEEMDRVLRNRPQANADIHGIELCFNDSQMSDKPISGCLPLSSLRLLVPPVQLLSAALWQIVKQGTVEHYGLLEEFISTMLETVPELLTDTETVQLLIGLRAKVVLELCRSDDFATPENIRPHLSRINAYITRQDEETSRFAVKASMTNFLKLVHTLVDDKHQRDVFYQKIFPTVFGDKYDSALQALMRKFLFNLQKLLPVPSLEQTSLWLSLSPPVLKECVDFVSQPEHLTTLIQHHKNHGHEVPQTLPSAGDDCILASLSYHLAKMDNDEGATAVKSESDRHRENSLGSAYEQDREENFKEIGSKVAMIEERNGQQLTDDLSDHQGASVEVILQPFDESDSNDDEDMDKKWFRHLKTHNRTSAKTKEPFSSENEPLNVAPQELISSDSCKRSSRMKTCSICRETFTCSADLTSHMRCHTDQNPYVCLHCGKDFDSYEDWETHEEGECSNQHPHVEKEYAQENSSSGTHKKNRKNSALLKATAQIQTAVAVTADSNHFIINACNFQSAATSFETVESETVAPQNSANGSLNTSRIIKCTMCEKNLSSIALMKSHYSKSHKVRGPYPCPLCKRTFVRLCELVRHRQNKKQYQCAACKKCFESPGQLNDHEKVHTATPRVCETCGKSFKSLRCLTLHQRKHKKRQPTVCSYCGKQFGEARFLKAHMVRHTGGYPCQLCGKKYNQKTYLKWHLLRHMGQEPYLCDTCGKGWPTAAQLKLHMVQHTEERPFKCDDCGASYKRGNHLVAHRQVKHMRLRPFKCDVCSKAFRLNGELKRHKMVHTGERPLRCPRCGKTFIKKYSLRVHREKACF
uniref:C2H2-type domain-containing protein n=1 Tax=Acanthochromis polyacanthus TaxID=80966 RepID=A0A3Q1I1E1_9TELE